MAHNKEKAILNLGSASDPYMDIEKELFLTRDILKIFQRFKFPTEIITKSDLVLRDIDILKKIDEVAILPEDVKDDLKSNIIICFSFSTTNDNVAAIFEPNATSPSKRLIAMKKLSKEGFHVGAAFMPVLPFISDSVEELTKAMDLFSKSKCNFLIPGPMTLFGNDNKSSRIKYYNCIKENFPELLEQTKDLFLDEKLEYPLKSYQNRIYRKIFLLSNEFRIKNTIL